MSDVGKCNKVETICAKCRYKLIIFHGGLGHWCTKWPIPMEIDPVTGLGAYLHRSNLGSIYYDDCPYPKCRTINYGNCPFYSLMVLRKKGEIVDDKKDKAV